MNNPRPHPVRARFATTRWSIVLKAGAAESAETRNALNELIQSYWYPLYAYCRRQGNGDHDAMDLTQGFFTHLLSQDALESVSPEKGRFRSFLLAAFKNYMANQRRAAGAIRRGGGSTTLSFSATDDFQTRYDREPADQETPELLFQRSWVEELLNRVRMQLTEEYHKAGKTELFGLLEPHLTHADDALPRTEIGRQLNLSPAALNMSLHRMRRRYGELLRQEVAATVANPADVEEELRTLMEVVGSRG